MTKLKCQKELQNYKNIYHKRIIYCFNPPPPVSKYKILRLFTICLAKIVVTVYQSTPVPRNKPLISQRHFQYLLCSQHLKFLLLFRCLVFVFSILQNDPPRLRLDWIFVYVDPRGRRKG